jgi:carbon monoxide dehydrogenase subunit G
MEIAGEFMFSAPQDGVWEVMRDPRALAVIVPMAMNMREVGEYLYTGSLFFKVGAVAGTFQGQIQLTNILAPDSYDIEVQGTSSVGNVIIKGRMRLEPHDDQTIMFYQGTVNFGGRIATVGSRLLDVAVRSIMTQSFQTLDRYLSVKYRKS